MKKKQLHLIDSSKAIIALLEKTKKITEIQSDIEKNRVYHDKEGDKGSFEDKV
jgi:hypothetical protein